VQVGNFSHLHFYNRKVLPIVQNFFLSRAKSISVMAHFLCHYFMNALTTFPDFICQSIPMGFSIPQDLKR